MNISISDITVRAPNRPVRLFSIGSLEIPFGSRILIQGPSGRGKTTLLHLLAGQFLPQTGRIKLGETELTALNHEARSRIRRKHFGIIFQRLNLLEHLDAVENVLLGAREVSKASEPGARNALTRVGLASIMRQRVGSMSPGEQQRVAVARILAHVPDIILADEPTSSLDQLNAEAVMQALCEAAVGRTLLVVSHDQRIQPFFETVWDFSSLVKA